MVEGHDRGWERLAKLFIWIAQVNYKDALVPNDLLHGRPMPPKRG